MSLMEEPLEKLGSRKSRSLPQVSSIQELQSLISAEDGQEFVKRLQERGSIEYSSFRVAAFRITQAATYIQDAIKVRKPQNRITEKGEISWITPIGGYQFCHSKPWKLFTFFIIWVHLLLVYDGINNKRFTVPWWVFLIQLTCLVILTIDCLIRLYSHDSDLTTSGWTKCLIFVLIMDYLRLILVAIAIPDLESIIILLQCFRPYYLVYSARSLRSVVKAVLRSLPKIFDFVWIIAIVVFIFGIIGYELFHEINPKFFGSKETALFSLMVTLTTANFPDVMMESYAYSPLTVIFFFVPYVIIIIVILLPTILAVVYQAYHTQTQLQFVTIQKLQTEALHKAFDVLTYHLKPIKRHSHGIGINDELTVSLGSWVDLMKHLRPDLSIQHCQVLYTTLRLDEELILKSPLESEHILLNRSSGLTLNEWYKIPEFLEVKFEIAPTATIAHRLITLQTTLDQVMDLYSHKRTFMNRCKSSIYRFRIFMLFIFTSPICDNIIDWIVWLNTMVLISLNWYYIHNDIENWVSLGYLLDVVCCIFIAEMGLKMYTYGIRAFFHNTFLVCDLMLVLLTIFITVWIGPVADRDNYVTLLRGIRILRISRQFPRMRLIFRFFTSLSRAFGILLLTIFCLFYIFSMIGMVLFGGDVSKQNVIFRYKQAVDNKDMEMESYWMGVLNTYYYLNNMNDLFHSMITLMELAVVNNWQVVSGTFIAMKQNDYYRVYFITFYFCAVILLLNIIIAFILDIFITQYSKNFSENSLLYRYKKYVMMSILIHQLQDADEDFDLLHWHITRRVRPALLMQTLFEDNTNAPAQKTQKYITTQKQQNIHNIHNIDHSPSKLSKLSKLSKYSKMSRFSSRLSGMEHTSVTLKAQPSMSAMSMLVLPNSLQSGSTVPSQLSLLSREEVINLTQIVNYDDLQQMPWGQESLTRDFLHLYNNDNYYKQKHRLYNRNFAEITKSELMCNRQTPAINTPYDGYSFTENINEYYKYRENQKNILNDDDDKIHIVYSGYYDEENDEENELKTDIDIANYDDEEIIGYHSNHRMRFPETFWHVDEQGFTADIGSFEPIV